MASIQFAQGPSFELKRGIGQRLSDKLHCYPHSDMLRGAAALIVVAEHACGFP